MLRALQHMENSFLFSQTLSCWAQSLLLMGRAGQGGSAVHVLSSSTKELPTNGSVWID